VEELGEIPENEEQMTSQALSSAVKAAGGEESECRPDRAEGMKTVRCVGIVGEQTLSGSEHAMDLEASLSWR